MLVSWSKDKTSGTNLRSLWDIIIHGIRHFSSFLPAPYHHRLLLTRKVNPTASSLRQVKLEKAGLRLHISSFWSSVSESLLVRGSCVSGEAAVTRASVHLQRSDARALIGALLCGNGEVLLGASWGWTAARTETANPKTATLPIFAENKMKKNVCKWSYSHV